MEIFLHHLIYEGGRERRSEVAREGRGLSMTPIHMCTFDGSFMDACTNKEIFTAYLMRV